MCGTCGCSDTEGGVTIRRPGQKHDNGHEHHHGTHHHHGPHGQHTHNHGQHGAHEHGHDHVHHDHHHHHHDRTGHIHAHHHGNHHHHDNNHEHHHGHQDSPKAREIRLEQDILSHNNLLAERNRGYLEAKGITALNFISSPGAGKTTLLEKTLGKLKDKIPFFVIEGDQQTMNDAERIDATGVPVVQINTGSGCHLDASMINSAMKQLDPGPESLLLIENVGNLVCPALFDLGESHRIVMFSVPEGDDKPAKYPTIFRNADYCIINKIDLLPHVPFDLEKAREYARRINPGIRFFEVSAYTGEGMDTWTDWLKSLKAVKNH
ncbi:hydrogenase nickel incorporation protein HypB [Natronogracilivirga saccharolytica]|uniref:Hydrogenase nickel incorporation protein HypB n=1 Tax=Natronogracilivirga saccharolytica TaxID=2812953 RepID=A0A8J7RH56_9BACT|nr:hydrogenase nickel incorporation protein HypB [Natronogracilivirga saccharolytica]MBP3191755.1 hydrogenase nickel incorporation protein HypB [Natronogracilivirga saccharolytica]